MDTENVDRLNFKLLSTPELAEEYVALSELEPELVTVISSEPEKESTKLQWGFTEVAAVVTIVQATFYFTELGLKFHKWLKDGKAKRLILQTAVKTIEISDEDSEDDTIAKVKDAMKP